MLRNIIRGVYSIRWYIALSADGVHKFFSFPSLPDNFIKNVFAFSFVLFASVEDSTKLFSRYCALLRSSFTGVCSASVCIERFDSFDIIPLFFVLYQVVIRQYACVYMIDLHMVGDPMFVYHAGKFQSAYDVEGFRGTL